MLLHSLHSGPYYMNRLQNKNYSQSSDTNIINTTFSELSRMRNLDIIINTIPFTFELNKMLLIVITY